jgi:HK97 family phage major capsid protein
MNTDKITDLKQQRARAVGELRSLIESAEADNDGKGRALNAEERQTRDRVNGEIDSLNERIENVESVRKAVADQAAFHNSMDTTALGHDGESRDAAGELRSYTDAFDKYLRTGIVGLDADERRTLGRGFEQRDGMVAGTVGDGGYTVPQDFSKVLFALKIQGGAVRKTRVNNMVTGDGRALPVPFASAHAAASWGSEATAPSVTKETFLSTTLNAYPAVTLQKISFELMEDSAFDLVSYISNIIAQKIGRLENAGFITGAGSTQPTGMINVGSVAETETALAAGPTADEVIAWYYKLGPVYRANGEFIMHDTLEAVLRGLKATTGQYLWAPGLTAEAPNTLLGRPIYNDPDLQATGTDENVVGMFADFSNFYVIRDVNSLVIRRLDERYADTRQVGFVAWHRCDGHVIDTNAGAQLAVGSG